VVVVLLSSITLSFLLLPFPLPGFLTLIPVTVESTCDNKPAAKVVSMTRVVLGERYEYDMTPKHQQRIILQKTLANRDGFSSLLLTSSCSSIIALRPCSYYSNDKCNLFMLLLVRPILFAFLKSESTKKLIIDLLHALAKSTDNTLDDGAVALIERSLMKTKK